MTREELKEKIEKAIATLENAQRSLQFTNIPVHVIEVYIKQESGIVLKKYN